MKESFQPSAISCQPVGWAKSAALPNESERWASPAQPSLRNSHVPSKELMTLLAVAVGGGALSLVLGAITPLRTGLAAGGILVTLVLLVSGWRQHKYVRTLIERL
jgi:hypothetical protein